MAFFSLLFDRRPNSFVCQHFSRLVELIRMSHRHFVEFRLIRQLASARVSNREDLFTFSDRATCTWRRIKTSRERERNRLINDMRRFVLTCIRRSHRVVRHGIVGCRVVIVGRVRYRRWNGPETDIR